MNEQIKKALDIAIEYGGIDGDHHKTWVIDQMVRALTNCPTLKENLKDCKGVDFVYEYQGESEEYKKLVADACAGEDGPNSYEWDEGIAP